MLSYHIRIICKLHINRYLYLLLAGFPRSISLNSLKSPIMIHRLANRINIKQFYPYNVLSRVDYSFYHMSSYYLVNLVLLIKCQSTYLLLNVLTNVCSSSSIQWMICRLSVLFCMVSNFAVSIVHQLFDLLLCECF